MNSSMAQCRVRLLCFFVGFFSTIYPGLAVGPRLLVNASLEAGRPIPDTLFGIFFEEINHAGAGGLWAELVSNRGFEEGGPNTPSNIEPWSIVGDKSILSVSTDNSSCFERNKVALKMEVFCDLKAGIVCPADGVGISNPGFWGMNIEQGKTYKLVMHVRSSGPINIFVSLTASNGLQPLVTANIIAPFSSVSNWTRMEAFLEAKGTNHNSSLQLTTTSKGVVWFDQISLMPSDTYKGHGFRNDLFGMLADLKPRFLRFPGGCFVEGEWLRNAFRWKATVGPWEERPGHFGDVWMYWTDDGLGYFEFLQLAEDLGALPIWVFNIGISHQESVETLDIQPFVQEALDSIEFARGDPSSTWGSVRAAMGHREQFELKYVALGNEDCKKRNYRENYLTFYDAIKHAYPDIKIISNCDGSSQALDHPADLYDFHIYDSATNMFSMRSKFDNATRLGPKAFVSEYAVQRSEGGNGTLLGALAEAGFLIGLEKNSDLVQMASYAPIFVNENNRRATPDAIVFNSSQHYGIPSYWMQQMFSDSSGGTLLETLLEINSSSVIASAIAYQAPIDRRNYISIKIVNFGSESLSLGISVAGLERSSVQMNGSTKTVLTSANPMDENSFTQPRKIVPIQTPLPNAAKEMDVVLHPYSFTSFDLLKVLTPPDFV